MSTSDFLSTSGTNSYLTPSIEQQGLPAWYQNAEQQILGQASTIAGASQPLYQGPQLADFSNPQQQAFQGVNNLQGSTNAPLQSSIGTAGNLSQGFNQSQFQNYLNPYTQNVVNDISTQGQQTLNQELLPGTAGSFIQAGAFGGSQYGNTLAQVIKGQNQNILQQQNQALQSSQQNAMGNYLTGQQNQNTALQNVGNLTNQYDTQNLNNLNAQLNVGNQQQQQQQNAYNVAQQNFYNQANYPLEQLGIVQSALRGTTIPTEGQIYTPSSTSGSSASSLLSLLQGLQGNSGSSGLAKGGMVKKGYATGNSIANTQPTTDPFSSSSALSPNLFYRERLMLNNLKALGQPTIPNQEPPGEFPSQVTNNLVNNPIYAPNGNKNLVDPTASSLSQIQQIMQTLGQSNLKSNAFSRGGKIGYADGGQDTGDLTAQEITSMVQNAATPKAGTALASLPPLDTNSFPTPQPAAAQFPGMDPGMMAERQRVALENIRQLQQLAQGAPEAQQQAQQARQQYANIDQQTSAQQLAALVQQKPWLTQPYAGAANPDVTLLAANAIKDQNPGLSTALTLLGGPSQDELSQRNAYQDQLRNLTLGPAGTQEKATEMNYTDKQKALEEAAQNSSAGLGTSALFNSPMGMITQKQVIDNQIAASKSAGQDTTQLQNMSDSLGSMITGKTQTPGQKALASGIAKEVTDEKGPYQTEQANYNQILTNHQKAVTLLNSLPDNAFNSLRNSSTFDQWINNTSDPQTLSELKEYQNLLAPRITAIKGNVPLRNLTEFNWANNQLNGLAQSKEGALAREDYANQYAKLQSALTDEAAQLSKNSLGSPTPVDYATAKNQVFNAFNKANPNTSLFNNGANPAVDGEVSVVPSNIVGDDKVNDMITRTRALLTKGTPTASTASPDSTGQPSALDRLKAKALSVAPAPQGSNPPANSMPQGNLSAGG